MLSLVITDFRSEAIAGDIRTEFVDSDFLSFLSAAEHRAYLRIWLDAIVTKKAEFVPPEFPVDYPDSQNLSVVLPKYIQAKTKEVFNKFSEDLNTQKETAKFAMETVMENAADRLPKCELNSTNNVIKNIVKNLEKVTTAKEFHLVERVSARPCLSIVERELIVREKDQHSSFFAEVCRNIAKSHIR